MEQKERQLSLGIQSFSRIRHDGCVYVDKTDLVWRMANTGTKFNFFSRPRRFGKSLLIDTLACYFAGKKDLFAGLKIMALEDRWVERPVVRLDMSMGGANAEALRTYFDFCFSGYEEQFGISPKSAANLAVRFDNIITTAYKATGQRVAILIDEYDAPLQHSWKTPYHEGCTEVYREVFSTLKARDEYEEFVLITGVTKFTQISLFSVLNNLRNISFDPAFAAVCGITEDEIDEHFRPELQRIGEKNRWTPQQTREHLKEMYDGYHFSKDNMVDIYSPYCLLSALCDGELNSYWASSGATALLPKFVDDLELHLEQLDHSLIEADVLESSDVTGGGAELFLYQCGYLTIKGFEDRTYELGFPNQEVRQALSKVVLPALTMRSVGAMVTSQSRLRFNMNRGDVAEAMRGLTALIADVPYSNKKMASMHMEERYRLIVSTVLSAVGFRVEVERMLASGRIDVVAWTTNFIYVIELKLQNNGGLAAAAKQIAEHNYLVPFSGDGRKVLGLAIELDDLGKGVTNWTTVEA